MYLECSRNQQSVYKDSLPSCLDSSSLNSFCSTIAFPLSLAWLLTPANADIILNRFTSTPSNENTDSEIGEHGDRDGWKELQNLLDIAVKDKSSVEAKQMSTALHLLQVNNKLVHHQNKGLRATIATKKRHQTKGKPLDLQQRKEFESAGVFWSPSRVSVTAPTLASSTFHCFHCLAH
jgi:hypothetical protein